MKVAIHQPDYIPYLGYFYKASMADVFVFLDDCQFSSTNWHNWNRIKGSQGEERLKIPTNYKMGMLINQVRTRDELDWKRKHLRALEMNYRRAPYFGVVYDTFANLLMRMYDNLAEQNIAIDTAFFRRFGISTKLYRSSDMGINTKSEERVLDICEKLGATEYLSGSGALAYQQEAHFTERGIKLTYLSHHIKEYAQQWGPYIANLSVIDYQFNCGFTTDLQ
ncbi:hypothetical protein AGMMS49992_29020 [Clostridia bacterium]|nr:hypothetical protein AGMMS49992_29020 [Clostridia bacterium]